MVVEGVALSLYPFTFWYYFFQQNVTMIGQLLISVYTLTASVRFGKGSLVASKEAYIQSIRSE